MKKYKNILSMIVALCILATTFVSAPIVASAEDTATEEFDFVENEILITADTEIYSSNAVINEVTAAIQSSFDEVASFEVTLDSFRAVNDDCDMYTIVLSNEYNSTADILELCERINSENEDMIAEPNYYVELEDCSAADEEQFEMLFGSSGANSMWHLNETWTREAMGFCDNKGEDIAVAVIDTGCNVNHEHLQNDLVSFSINQVTYHGFNVSDVGGVFDITDNYGHGTAVASAISGENSANSFYGVAPNAKILPIKISDQNRFETDLIVEAIDMIKYYNTFFAENGVNAPPKISVVNMSFGFRQYNFHKDVDSGIKMALESLAESCILVAAAGNGSTDAEVRYSSYPASFDCVIGVMAYAPDLKMASYSNYDKSGEYYEVTAPGTYIRVADYTDADGYKNLSGTSFASPIVAGAVALYLSNYPDATLSRAKEDLLNSMTDTVAPYFSNDSYHNKLNVVDYLNLGLLNENGMYSRVSDDLLWTYNHNDRSLLFSNCEEIWDYDPGDAPWYRFRNLTNSCTISDDFLYVGCYALYNFNKMENLTIGSNVEYIGDYACYSCEKLEAINIPPSVTELGYCAFAKCYSATTLTLPPVIEYYNMSIFENCSSLTTVLIPSGWTQIPGATFSNCTSLSFVAIPDTVTKINSGAFRNCSNLVYISLPTSLEQIGINAFANCTSLVSVVVPRNVTRIDSSAFSGCTNLQNVTLFDNITTMKTKIFKDCPNVVIKTYVESESLIYALENDIAYELMYRLEPAQSSNISIDRSTFETTETFEISGLPLYVSIGTFEEQYISLDNGFTLSYEGLVSGYITQGTVIKVLKGAEIKETYVVG